MDTLLRGRRLFLIAVLVAGFGGCARGKGSVVGTSDVAPRGESRLKARDGGAPGPSSIPADFRKSFTKLNRARFTSNGHAGGRYEVDVYANATGARAAQSMSGDVAVGARLIKEHFERGEGGPIMMMEKMERGFDPEHGDWRYVVVNSAGQQVEDGHVDSCAGCHDDAPHDHVFRVPE